MNLNEINPTTEQQIKKLKKSKLPIPLWSIFVALFFLLGSIFGYISFIITLWK